VDRLRHELLAGARRQLVLQTPQLILLDLHLPDGSGMSLLDDEKVRVESEIVLVTGNASLETSIHALRMGAADYLIKPVNIKQLKGILSRLSSPATIDSEIETLKSEAEGSARFGHLRGRSAAMLRIYAQIGRVAPTAVSVLITGESGTGKEVVARTLHDLSRRRERPSLAVNCGAISPNLIESELFGHEKGAFTGAVARKIGRFERASCGTLFLDEIGDMSLVLQSKILRAVQEREVERVGGGEAIPIDVRLIAATNKDLKQMIAEGRFREDLYYRLAVVTIRLPQLVARGDDLILLTSYFLQEFGKQYGKGIAAISDRATALLRAHSWVGNVRELRNVIERAVLLCEGDVLRSVDLPEEWLAGATKSEVVSGGGPLATLQDAEARHISHVLTHTHGQIGEAAQILGVHRNTLARKIKEYRL